MRFEVSFRIRKRRYYLVIGIRREFSHITTGIDGDTKRVLILKKWEPQP